MPLDDAGHVRPRAVEHVSLVERTTAELARMLDDSGWAVGDKLPGEVRLAEMLGVGRSTTREAVRALIASGRLASRQGSGTYVASLSAIPGLDRALREAEVADVWEVRLGLEVQAAQLAALRRTDEDVAALRSALAARDAATDIDGFVDADVALHRASVVAAHNPVLLQVFDSFAAALRGAALEVARRGGSRGHDPALDATRLHHDLVEAITEGDSAAAGRSVRVHLEMFLGAVRR
ncbi:FadR/GntR family transcriptional regulator [Pseudonocardia spinosispora]|uniref:FadR/GntR family transcriptional regulator n=1 Tax=Pseudonocardia spinosispora TaxID=103441 RepID=UPI00068530A5|nr:FCD domain-containing protein [Pseudonocardia spinosispora]